jgi:hypothetical protein
MRYFNKLINVTMHAHALLCGKLPNVSILAEYCWVVDLGAFGNTLVRVLTAPKALW